MLQLTRATIFTEVTEERPSIPENKFNFLEYDQLESKINNNEILTGTILNLSYLLQTIPKLKFTTDSYFIYVRCYWRFNKYPPIR